MYEDPVFQSQLYHDALDIEEKDEPDYFAFGCPVCHNMIWIYEDDPQNGIYNCKCGAKVRYWQTTEWDSVRDEDIPSIDFCLVSPANAGFQTPRVLWGV